MRKRRCKCRASVGRSAPWAAWFGFAAHTVAADSCLAHGARARTLLKCGFRFERTEDSYFSGAMFFGLLMGEGLFAVVLLFVVVANCECAVDALTYGAPAGMLLILPFLLPFSKVVWLSIDVLVRPVLPEAVLKLQHGLGDGTDRRDERLG